MLKQKKLIALIAGIISICLALLFIWEGLGAKKPVIPADAPEGLLTAKLAYHRPNLFSGMHAGAFQAILSGDLFRSKVFSDGGLIAYSEKPVSARFYFPDGMKVLNGYWQGVNASLIIPRPEEVEIKGEPGYVDRDWGQSITARGLQAVSPFFDVTLPFDASFHHQTVKVVAKMEIFYPIIDEQGFHNETSVLTKELVLTVVSPEELALREAHKAWQGRIVKMGCKVAIFGLLGVVLLIYAYGISRYSGPNIENVRMRAVNGDSSAIKKLIGLIPGKNETLRSQIFQDLAFVFYETISHGEVIMEIGKVSDYHLKEKFVEYLLASPDYLPENHQAKIESALSHLNPAAVIPVLNQQKKWGEDRRYYPGIIFFGQVKDRSAVEALIKFISKKSQYHTSVARDTLLLAAEALHKQGSAVLVERILTERISQAKDFWSLAAAVRVLTRLEWHHENAAVEVKTRYFFTLLVLNLHYPEELWRDPHNPEQEVLFNPRKVMEEAIRLKEELLTFGKENLGNLQYLRSLLAEETPELEEIKRLINESQNYRAVL